MRVTGKDGERQEDTEDAGVEAAGTVRVDVALTNPPATAGRD